MRIGSLFSGIGGFDLGLERAGHDIVWQVEIDKQARSVLRRHWPDVDLHEDVRDVGSDELSPAELICGGFPCQDLSVAGKREGLAGERSGLWHEFRRVVGDIAPRWVLIENVPGLLSSNGGADMAVVLRGLEELGYGWTYRVLDSQYFGVAQRRRRVFIVGCSGGRPRPEILFEPESLPWHSAPSREARAGVAASPSCRAYGESGPGWWRGGIGALRAEGENRPSRPSHVVAHTLRGRGFDASEDGTGRGTPIVAFDTTQITSKGNYSNPKAGDPCHPVAAGAHPPAIAYGFNGDQPEKTRSMGEAPDQNPTLRSGAVNHVAGTITIPRRLTPRECERLQGFPDDWTRYDDQGNELADSPRYRMLGNAVTVNVAEWIGRRLAEAL